MKYLKLLFLFLFCFNNNIYSFYYNQDDSIPPQVLNLEQDRLKKSLRLDNLNEVPSYMPSVPLLHAGIIAQDFSVIENALIYEPHTINYAAFNGNTPLHLAVAKKNQSIIALLINKGAYINSINNNGDTPLHVAVKNNTPLPIIEYLILRGATLNLINNDGLTIIDIARKYKYNDILLFLASLDRSFKYKPLLITNIATVTNTVTNTIQTTNLLTNILQSTNTVDVPVLLTNYFEITNLTEMTNTLDMTNILDITNTLDMTNTIDMTNMLELTNILAITNSSVPEPTSVDDTGNTDTETQDDSYPNLTDAVINDILNNTANQNSSDTEILTGDNDSI